MVTYGYYANRLMTGHLALWVHRRVVTCICVCGWVLHGHCTKCPCAFVVAYIYAYGVKRE